MSWWSFEKLRETLWQVLIDVVMLPYDTGVWLFDQVWGSIPTVNIASEIASTVYWMSLANAWVPIAELFAAFVILWTFQGTFITIKYIIKVIPTIG